MADQRENRDKASDTGKKGGQQGSGNFKNDPQRASEAGKKGGQQSHGGGNKSDKS
ncbi:MAG: KGG domain-containing protein [Leclercia sp.]|uniref:Stress-induced acidophilic repeat motif-containing protein n=2 Tax=Silvania TaxID=3016631 RepID=A0A9J6QCT5_9ENTR|nr:MULTISPECIES: KGG domain-containing protein [Silvania]MCU6664256.1 stress-induced acidophilic repeat motif-containing protein [Silvania hatchlandensis]MCU6668777.1 stress-induced acidophilic repeat motif-containing protein [Silvania confinis]